MISIATYKFEVNAIFGKETLEKNGITARIDRVSNKNQDFYNLSVDKNDFENSQNIIADLNLDESPIDPESENYIKDHKEWSTNMYDPGHYTGGRIPHFLLDKSNFIYFAIYFIGFGLLILYVVFRQRNYRFELSNLVFPGIYLLIGISLAIQYRKKKKKMKN